jgi:hypothetical protein
MKNWLVLVRKKNTRRTERKAANRKSLAAFLLLCFTYALLQKHYNFYAIFEQANK